MAKYLVIRVSRCIVVLTEEEFMSLMSTNPDLFKTSLKRGKGYMRYKQQQKRQHPERGGKE